MNLSMQPPVKQPVDELLDSSSLVLVEKFGFPIHLSDLRIHIFKAAELLARKLLKAGIVDKGHGIDHAFRVLENASKAVFGSAFPSTLTSTQTEAVLLAALLHDADDGKFFHTKDYANARDIMESASISGETKVLVLELIGLVSCSKNGNNPVPPDEEWKLIPRDADRLEALGLQGIARCAEYTLHTGRPWFLPEDPRATNEEELSRVANRQLFDDYLVRGGTSKSFIGHFYEKLIWISEMGSGNKWLIEEAKRRRQPLVDYLFQFGVTGTVDELMIRDLVKQELG